MILSTAIAAHMAPVVWALVACATLCYMVAASPQRWLGRWSTAALVLGFVLHALLLLGTTTGHAFTPVGARLGFGPVLSMTAWLVIAVYVVESRVLPLSSARWWLGLTGAAAVALAALFPGDQLHVGSGLAPLHFVLGVASYGLFGSAVLHGLMLDAADRRLRAGVRADPARSGQGMPLLQLERLTYNFVAAGFAVLTATLALGLVTAVHWRLDHKTVLALLAWLVFAALLAGRHGYGWRGRRGTRWLYAGAVLLLLAYVGTRFVLEVLLGR
jgi:ABC-type uncharacterized transport system permease subunit